MEIGLLPCLEGNVCEARGRFILFCKLHTSHDNRKAWWVRRTAGGKAHCPSFWLSAQFVPSFSYELTAPVILRSVYMAVRCMRGGRSVRREEDGVVSESRSEGKERERER